MGAVLGAALGKYLEATTLSPRGPSLQGPKHLWPVGICAPGGSPLKGISPLGVGVLSVRGAGDAAFLGISFLRLPGRGSSVSCLDFLAAPLTLSISILFGAAGWAEGHRVGRHRRSRAPALAALAANRPSQGLLAATGGLRGGDSPPPQVPPSEPFPRGFRVSRRRKRCRARRGRDGGLPMEEGGGTSHPPRRPSAPASQLGEPLFLPGPRLEGGGSEPFREAPWAAPGSGATAPARAGSGGAPGTASAEAFGSNARLRLRRVTSLLPPAGQARVKGCA